MWRQFQLLPLPSFNFSTLTLQWYKTIYKFINIRLNSCFKDCLNVHYFLRKTTGYQKSLFPETKSLQNTDFLNMSEPLNHQPQNILKESNVHLHILTFSTILFSDIKCGRHPSKYVAVLKWCGLCDWLRSLGEIWSVYSVEQFRKECLDGDISHYFHLRMNRAWCSG